MNRIGVLLLSGVLALSVPMQAYMLEAETAETLAVNEYIEETEQLPETESVFKTENTVETEIVIETENIVETEIVIETEVIESETILLGDEEKLPVAESVEDRLLGEFVDRCYGLLLNRKNDEIGKADWMNRLRNEGATGADISLGFVESQEFLSRKLSNEAYIEILYRAFLGREADDEGKEYWMTILEANVSRRFVARGFIESDEFSQLCEDYGIVRGSVALTEARDQNYEVTEFINRCYNVFLGRNAEVIGLNDWCSKVNNKEISASRLAYGFVFSQEFIGKEYSNEAYVERLYQGMFGRVGDAEGTAYWMDVFSRGKTREFVFWGFANSDEFISWMRENLGELLPDTEIKTIGQQEVEHYVDQILAEVDYKLYGSYMWCVNNIEYEKLPIPMEPEEGYTEDEYYAVYAYENRTGNCYCYAAAFYQLALELGYDAEFVQGKVGMAAGGTGPHGWVEIHVNGSTYVCDPDAQYETGRNAYMVTYSSAPFKYYKD